MRAHCLCLSLVVGCATPMTSLRDDNQRLSETVSELRGDRRMQDRKMRDLQHQLDELKAKQTASDPVPTLPVVVAAPPGTAMGQGQMQAAPAAEAGRVVGVADDGTEIVYEGAAMAAHPAALPAMPPPDDDAAMPRRATSAGSRASAQQRPTVAPPMPDVPVVADRLEVTRRVPPIAGGAASISARAQRRTSARERELPIDRAGDPAAAADYRAAVDLVKAAKYDAALDALRGYLQRNPHNDYADNAQYWIGEVFYAQKDYPRALSEFRKVVEVYPRGNKVPDALLKVGYCHQAMGQREKARAVLEQVVTMYPRSEPAMLAAKRLEAP